MLAMQVIRTGMQLTVWGTGPSSPQLQGVGGAAAALSGGRLREDGRWVPGGAAPHYA